MKLLLLSLFLIFSCDNPTKSNSTECTLLAPPDCAGVCGGSSVKDTCGVCGGNNSPNTGTCDCLGTPNGEEVVDCSGECGGNETCTVQLGLFLNESGGLDVTYASNGNIHGFQFNITGLSIIGISGGGADEAGFMTSSSSTTVLGFSLSGNFIPAGNNVLTIITYEGSGEVCLSNPVVSGLTGSSLAVELGDCITI